MRQTFVKAALVASCMATVACKQAPTEMGPGQYPVMTIATTDRTIPSNYSAKINGRQDIAIYPQVSGTITEVCFNEGQTVIVRFASLGWFHSRRSAAFANWTHP